MKAKSRWLKDVHAGLIGIVVNGGKTQVPLHYFEQKVKEFLLDLPPNSPKPKVGVLVDVPGLGLVDLGGWLEALTTND